MADSDFYGLTRNTWPGTWSPSTEAPIVLDKETRGGLRSIIGSNGDRLEDITGQRLVSGMFVFVEKDYSIDITTLENTNENYSLNTLFMGNGNCKEWNEDNMEIVVYIYNTSNYEIVQVEEKHLTNH